MSVCLSRSLSPRLLIYCHANGEDIGALQEVAYWMVAVMGAHVLMPEYPGYGMASGQSNEVSVIANVQAAYRFAVDGLGWDPRHVIFLGRSIGTGPAVRLAADLACGGLILISPYTSVKDLVADHAGALTSWLVAEGPNVFATDGAMPRVKCPTIMVHGSRDAVIPSSQCRRLASLVKPSTQSSVQILDSCGHSGVELFYAAVAAANRLIRRHARNHRPLDLSVYLDDPALQGDTIAACVPAYDVATSSWSRPTLEAGRMPFRRHAPAGSRALLAVALPAHLLGAGNHAGV